jgi:hypothetical protein
MAQRKGRFGEQAPTDYAGNVLKQINEMSGSTTPPAATVATTARANTLVNRAASGSVTYSQALANYKKLYGLLQKMPETTNAVGKNVANKVRNISGKISNLQRGNNLQNEFFSLGGSEYTKGTGKYGDTGAGWTNAKVKQYWESAGKPEIGQEIINQRRGYDQYGNDLPGWTGDKSVFTTPVKSKKKKKK